MYGTVLVSCRPFGTKAKPISTRSEWSADQEEAEVLGGGEEVGQRRRRGAKPAGTATAAAAGQEPLAVEEAAEALSAAEEPVGRGGRRLRVSRKIRRVGRGRGDERRHARRHAPHGAQGVGRDQRRLLLPQPRNRVL